MCKYQYVRELLNIVTIKAYFESKRQKRRIAPHGSIKVFYERIQIIGYQPYLYCVVAADALQQISVNQRAKTAYKMYANIQKLWMNAVTLRDYSTCLSKLLWGPFGCLAGRAPTYGEGSTFEYQGKQFVGSKLSFARMDSINIYTRSTTFLRKTVWAMPKKSFIFRKPIFVSLM